jgi:hypothetical protein
MICAVKNSTLWNNTSTIVKLEQSMSREPWIILCFQIFDAQILHQYYADVVVGFRKESRMKLCRLKGKVERNKFVAIAQFILYPFYWEFLKSVIAFVERVDPSVITLVS